MIPPSGEKKRKRAPAPCEICLQHGHRKRECEHTQYAKPETPDPNVCLQVGEKIGVLDIEFSPGSTALLHEAAVVETTYVGDGKWIEGTAEFHIIVQSLVSTPVSKICPGLRTACSKSKHNFKDLFNGITQYVKTNSIKWLKAHNGIPADFLNLFHAARHHGFDLINELQQSGLLGFIDPGRIIPFHKITSLQHAKTGKGGATTYTGYLSNEKLFKLANEDKEMAQCKLTAHRALDDAKAERDWLTKLPQLTKALYGDNPRLECGISLQKFQIYAEQYAKRKAFLKGKD